TTENGVPGNTGTEKPEEKNTTPPVDPKEVEAIAGYGEFRFPGSELLQTDTRHQQFPGDAEIWNLNFASPQPYQTVADWYRDNVEKGARISETKGTDGSDITIIEYQSTEEKFTKRITVISTAGNKACKIRVNLTRKLMPEKISPGKTSRGN
ncbi:MAG: hypothetical protein ABIC40_03405, partial [bacterium]